MSAQEQITELMRRVDMLAGHEYRRGVSYMTTGDYGVGAKFRKEVEDFARKMVEPVAPPQSGCRHPHVVTHLSVIPPQALGHYCPDCQAAWVTFAKTATLTVPKPAI
jgi:hypothetical protein